ncbi:MAG: c-type cytochrome [Pseudomonadota bacterium]
MAMTADATADRLDDGPAGGPVGRGRRRRRTAGLAALAVAAPLVLAAPARGDMISTEGMEPWEVCGLCHGYTGLSATAKFPRLAGQKPAYIVKQLEDILDGRRTNEGGQMRAIVTEVDPADFAAIADWFATQDPPEPDAPDGDAAEGARLWAAMDCAACHGAGPVLPEDAPADAPEGLVAPHLTAQHERYLVKQLTDFREGRRTNDPGGVMQARVATLDDAAIEALAAFLAAEPRP